MKFSGKCEWCNSYNINLTGTRIVNDSYAPENFTPSFFNQLFKACELCKLTLKQQGKVEDVEMSPPDEEPMMISSTYSERETEIISCFSGLGKIFNGYIDKIFIIPRGEFPEGSDFSNRLSFVVSFKGLSLVSYANWAAREKKSILHLWDEQETRTKFWSSRLMRIVIALGKIQSECGDVLDIWLRSYTRFAHINSFVKTQPELIQAFPKKLLRID